MKSFKQYLETHHKDSEEIGDYESYTNKSGEAFWGNNGAGILPICPSTKRILVGLRSEYVNEPNTWGIFGGAVDSKENPKDSAERELREELGYIGKIKLVPSYIYTSPGGSFKYYNFIGIVDEEFKPRLNWENSNAQWITMDELLNLPDKHFGLTNLIENNKNQIISLIEQK